MRAVGPFQVPEAWFGDERTYRRQVTVAAEWALGMPESGEPVYVPKAEAELPLLLDLWPRVIALPLTDSVSIDDLIVGRAWPVHPLAVVERPVWADGRWCSPAEMFFHDVDHARFKIREDLLARGFSLPDPYRDGSTLDPTSGTHRTVLDVAARYVDDDGWHGAPVRAALATTWLAEIDAEPRRDVAEGARWLLFEMVHEKALPLDPRVLVAALSAPAHVDKLRAKSGHGFFADHGPPLDAIDALDAARPWLAALVADERA